MSAGLATLFGAVGTVAAMLAVLLPVIRAQGTALRREIDTLRGDLNTRMDRLDGRMDRLSDDLHSLSDRVARIEGTLSGPWRPANGSPAPPTVPPASESAS